MRHLVRLGRAHAHKWLIQSPGSQSPMREWSEYAIALLKDFYIKRAFNIAEYALCAAGSLARREATPYSDVDLFVIVSAPLCKPALQLVGSELRRALKSTHEVDWAMMLDPIGIDPVRMCDTPDALLMFCRQMQIPGLFHSVRNSVCILGNGDLLTQLKTLMEKTDGQPEWRFWLHDIKRAVSEFPRHRFSSDRVIVKSEIGRPLWLITNGLAKLHGIKGEGTLRQAESLLKGGWISPQVWKLIVDSHKAFEVLRTHLHMEHKQEYEEILKSTIEEKFRAMLIDTLLNVNCLQGMAEKFTCSNGFFGMSISKEFLTNDPIQFAKKG